MGIYSRDNINYQGMLQNMLAAKERGAAIRANAMRNQGQMWGNTISGIGNTFGNALIQYGQQSDAADKYADEQSWKAKQFDFQNRQLEQQKEMQLKQMDLSRELQGAQSVKEAELRKDEYMKDWQIANARLNAAKAELERNPNDSKLQEAVKEAQFNADYWRKKAGVQLPIAEVEVPAEPAETPKPQEQALTNVDLAAKVNEILSRAEYTDASKAEALELSDQIQDPKVKAEVQAKINAKGATKEDKLAANAAYKKKVAETINSWVPGQPVPDGFEVYYAGGKAKIRQKGKK